MNTAPRMPMIGVTGDVEAAGGSGTLRVRVSAAYLRTLAQAGAIPVVMYPDPALATGYVERLDGLLLTGGNDPDTTVWGVAMHPAATPMHAQRQAFELELLRAIDAVRGGSTPTLGVCLGMQLMGVHNAGAGALIQHLPDVVPTAGQHGQGCDTFHPIAAMADWARSELAGIEHGGAVASHHHQAINGPSLDRSRLRVLAQSFDGVVEAFDDPARPFYVGVQWHPERTPDAALGQGVIDRLVAVSRRAARG